MTCVLKESLYWVTIVFLLLQGCAFDSVFNKGRANLKKESLSTAIGNKSETVDRITKFPTRVCNVNDASEPDIVFEAAHSSFAKKDYLHAKLCFRKFANEFPRSKKIPLALWYLGLSCVKSNEIWAGIGAFKDLLILYPLHVLAVDARIALAEALWETGYWDEARLHLVSVSKLPNIGPILQVKVYILLGRISVKSMEYQAGDHYLKKAYYMYRQAEAAGESIDLELMGAILFYQAQLLDQVMRDLIIDKYKVASQRERHKSYLSMEAKAKWLLDAQDAYLRVTVLGPISWAKIAALRIGNLYEAFYESISDVSVVGNWGKTEEAIYIRETRRRILKILSGAMRKLRQNCNAESRTLYCNEWTLVEQQLQRFGMLSTKSGDVASDKMLVFP